MVTPHVIYFNQYRETTMNKILLAATLLSVSNLAFAGGTVQDPTTKLIFDFDNVSQEQAATDLNYCQGLAGSTEEQVTSAKGSGARGAARGALAGAAVGAISGGSGSDGAKTGAAIGVVGGRMRGNSAEAQGTANNLESYTTVLRNCMVEKHYVALN